GLSLGGLSTSGPYGYDFAHAYVAELLFYSGALTAAERQSTTAWLNQKYGVLGPVNTTAPVLGGSATEGSTLSTTTGSWTGATPLAYAYQWQRCSTAGDACVNLTSATGSSYTLGTADVGSTVRAVVTASNAYGSASAST